MELNYNYLCQTLHNKMEEQERFQQTIVNGAEAMWHHAGLSNSFWVHAVKAKLHAHNITMIKLANYKTPKELWSGIK